MEAIERKQILIESRKKESTNQIKVIIEQHIEIVHHLKQLSSVQGDIAQQLLKHHEAIETLHIGLGLKEDLSYYSFDLMNAEEH